MTTIAWDGNKISVDSMATKGGVQKNILKVKRFGELPGLEDIKRFGVNQKGPFITCCAGGITDWYEVIDWLVGNSDFPDGVECETVVVSQRQLLSFESSPIPIIENRKEIHAWGSGAQFALGALASGADAREAVKVAAKYDAWTGGRIYTMEP